MDFPKKQAQRLMPLYLLEYSEKLFTNHPDPSAPWGGGGGGSDYTAGQGITITNNEISVDTNVIAAKSDIPDFTKYYYVNNVIEENGEYFTKINGSGLEYSHPWSSNSISINVKNAELENNASIIIENTGGNKIAISDRIDVYNDGSNTGVSVEGNKVVINSHQHITSLEDGKLVYDVLGQVREFNLPITYDPRTYTLATEEWVQTRGYLTNTSLDNYALKTDIPTDVSQLYNDAGYATETWVQNQGYATSSEIPTNYVTTDTEQTITGLKTIGETSGTISEVDFSGFTFKLSNKAINHPEADIKIRNGSYDGYQHPIISSTKGLYVNLAKIKLGDDGNNTYGITMPDSSTWEADRVLATTNDIPSLDGYATQTWVENQGYKTSITSSDITTALGYTPGTSNFSGSYNELTDTPTFATVATTGSYNDLTDKPAIPEVPTNFVTTDTNQEITGFKTFDSAKLSVARTQGPIRTKLTFRPNMFMYYSGDSVAYFNLPTSKPKGTADAPTEYTLATTDDIHNPTITFTQGGTTKGTITLNQSGDQTIEFDAGGGGGGSTTNMVTTDTTQDITGEKTFVGNKRIKFKQSSPYDRVGFTGFDADGTEIGYLEMSKRDGDFTGNPISNMLGYWGNRSAPNPSSDVMLGFKYYTKDSDGNLRDFKLVVPPRYNETRATRYIPISVNGNTADNTGNINVPTQTLVFTLSDGSTVTVNVMTSATVSTTTTS